MITCTSAGLHVGHNALVEIGIGLDVGHDLRGDALVVADIAVGIFL